MKNVFLKNKKGFYNFDCTYYITKQGYLKKD